jgi:hypothetical protein
MKKSLEVRTIYFIGHSSKLIKIGMSNNIQSRMASIQRMCPVKLRLLAIMRGRPEDEKRLHLIFRRLHHHGEWFLAKPPLTTFIRKNKNTSIFHTRHRRHMNPLKKWLADRGVKMTWIAREIEIKRGHPCTRSQVSKWCAGRTVPGADSRRDIARATRGGVPASAWLRP